eukprot:5674016-Pyramimonas_sp.AAC.1
MQPGPTGRSKPKDSQSSDRMCNGVAVHVLGIMPRSQKHAWGSLWDAAEGTGSLLTSNIGDPVLHEHSHARCSESSTASWQRGHSNAGSTWAPSVLAPSAFRRPCLALDHMPPMEMVGSTDQASA